ncbi:hypothetical protein [Microbacterium sp. SA39]|uniref:hypothetical protein n=1 Tax=Microbacterium sp. SA39 TaxID=1263625 RepID=UPI0005FA20B0|nr:hypothetical protein [Microbacterium sp. SA39]KJQ52555.1 hypothetical protein RS85_03446 [Microbacterium sp. SA39]
MNARMRAIVGAISLSIVLSGCAGVPSIGVADERTGGVPESFESATAGNDEPGFLEGPIVLAYADGGVDVITWGSGSCPPRATSAAKEGTEFVVSFEHDAQGACTADMAPTTHSFTASSVGSAVPEVARISFPAYDEEHVVDVIAVED